MLLQLVHSVKSLKNRPKLLQKSWEIFRKTRHFPLPPSCSRVKVSYERKKISKWKVVKKRWLQIIIFESLCSLVNVNKDELKIVTNTKIISLFLPEVELSIRLFFCKRNILVFLQLLTFITSKLFLECIVNNDRKYPSWLGEKARCYFLEIKLSLKHQLLITVAVF